MIEFRKNNDESLSAQDCYRVIDINGDGNSVYIDGSLHINELEQIITKMKELQDGK